MWLWEPFLFKLSQIPRYVQRVNILHWEWRILSTEGVKTSGMDLPPPNSCSLGSPWFYYIAKDDLYLLILLLPLPECFSCSGNNWVIKIRMLHVLGKHSASWATSPVSQISFWMRKPILCQEFRTIHFLYNTMLWAEAAREACQLAWDLRSWEKKLQETPDRKWRHPWYYWVKKEWWRIPKLWNKVYFLGWPRAMMELNPGPHACCLPNYN